MNVAIASARYFFMLAESGQAWAARRTFLARQTLVEPRAEIIKAVTSQRSAQVGHPDRLFSILDFDPQSVVPQPQLLFAEFDQPQLFRDVGCADFARTRFYD